MEALTYTAKLRLPPDTNVQEVVEKTIEQIEMAERKNILVSQLSGGQRKRVSIGLELLADPKLFFLDEPTSGLDPGLDKKMMQLLKKLANQGRTIILVTHATANIRICDRIVFLGRSGRLCYFGSPKEAMNFFSINTGDFADIYNELETSDENINEWVTVKANVKEDFKKFHDLELNELSGVAIMVDTDNSKLSAVSYYQNIFFSSK